MLSRKLLDHHYGNFEDLTMVIAGVLAEQVGDLPCACVQVDEANIPGNPADGPLAAKAMNVILDRLKALHCDHLVLELARRPITDLEALKDVRTDIKLGIGVVDVKDNHVEIADEIAARIESAEKVVGPGRVG